MPVSLPISSVNNFCWTRRILTLDLPGVWINLGLNCIYFTLLKPLMQVLPQEPTAAIIIVLLQLQNPQKCLVAELGLGLGRSFFFGDAVCIKIHTYQCCKGCAFSFFLFSPSLLPRKRILMNSSFVSDQRCSYSAKQECIICRLKQWSAMKLLPASQNAYLPRLRESIQRQPSP